MKSTDIQKLSKKEKREYAKIILKCFGLLVVIAYLFYNSFLAVVIGSPLLYFLFKEEKKKYIARRRELAENRFKDVLQSVLTSLKAGYSIENAFLEAQKDLEYRFGEDDDMVYELKVLNRQVKNSIPIEKVMLNLANKLQSDSIMEFSVVFQIARKSGGDLGKILERTISIITRRMELKQEVSLLVAAKKYEQQIMNFVPMGIIFYIRLTNPGYFDSLYKNIFGVFVMTIALGVYYFAYMLSEKILDIA